MIVFLLVGVSLFLVYTISDGSNPLATLNLRASEDDQYTEDPLFGQLDAQPTPTLEYNSTSPTVTPTTAPGGATTPSTTTTPSITITPSTSITQVAASPTATKTPVPTATPTLTPTPMIEPTATPTVIAELPVAGFTDSIHPMMVVGGGILIGLALLF